VSVVAADCVSANTAATAAIVLGADAEAWLDKRNIPARLVTDDGAVSYVGGWPVDAVSPRRGVPEAARQAPAA
jgi:thiamine biosynthesis lipoprotein